ncbi:MAG: hypothetical protein KDC87_07165 [Planctomycetes bacterium]|nr:hypothetical protein [Planctomycetota bacterium]MCB9869725.1 hypothetical protein [Planctomycetota bacterium]
MARKNKSSSPAPKGRDKRGAVAAEPILEEVKTGGAGIDEGIVFTTFFLLAGALTLMWMIVEGRYPSP